MNRYGVIMAGGGGTRFWPLSRQKSPKQLINLSGNDAMVNEAIDRMNTVIDKDNVFIVTSEVQSAAMKEVTRGKMLPENILAEPAARNTAACIGLSAMTLLKKYGDGVMILTPADHYIKNVPELTKYFKIALETAEKENKLVTIGLKPNFPSTGFGYIKFNDAMEGNVKQVVEFKEKPDEETAKRYFESGEYVWNSGMFIWKASLILQKLKENVPDIYEDLAKIGDAMNTEYESKVLHEIYPGIRKISIDYAVMEKSASEGGVLVVPGDCGWNDVGSWDMMDILHEPDENGNVCLGDVTIVDAKNSVIYSSGRKVTVLGVDNLVVVETPDAIMVCDKDKAQDVKKIVDKLIEEGRDDLL